MDEVMSAEYYKTLLFYARAPLILRFKLYGSCAWRKDITESGLFCDHHRIQALPKDNAKLAMEKSGCRICSQA